MIVLKYYEILSKTIHAVLYLNKMLQVRLIGSRQTEENTKRIHNTVLLKVLYMA